MKNILVTGAAGFIGYHLSKRLIKEDYQVLGLDNINDYYDRDLKYGRLDQLGIDTGEIESNQLLESRTKSNFSFVKMDICEKEKLKELFDKMEFNYVVNLAAQAGVRYSLTNPDVYIQTNITGFFNVLDCSKKFEVDHFVYASSSSVYGMNDDQPFSTSDNVDHPVTFFTGSI